MALRRLNREQADLYKALVRGTEYAGPSGMGKVTARKCREFAARFAGVDFKTVRVAATSQPSQVDAPTSFRILRAWADFGNGACEVFWCCNNDGQCARLYESERIIFQRVLAYLRFGAMGLA